MKNWCIKKLYNLIDILKPKDDNIIVNCFLRQYVYKSCTGKIKSCKSILGTDNSLERFAKFWEEEKEGVMMMLTAQEYEFMHNEQFDSKDLAVLRHFIGNTALFFKNSKKEYDLKKLLDK